MKSSMRVGAFGKADSYAHAVTRLRFGLKTKILALPRVRQVFAAIREGRIDVGILPLENTTGGWIGDVVLGLIRMAEMDPQTRIIEELDLPVVLSLASKLKAGELGQVRRIYSHPVPLGHCEDWLSRHVPGAELLEVSSTSEAAERASREKGSAAVCNAGAARRLGLHVLVPHIEKETANLTRFVVISRTLPPSSGSKRKSSLWFSLPDKPGSLRAALGAFGSHGVNMTRIESRSLDAFKTYRFYVEIEGDGNQPKVRSALAALTRRAQRWALIGSYPVKILKPR